METQNWLFFTVLCLLSFFSQRAACYNITETLDSYSGYSQFNQLLSRTGLASEINRIGTATVLVVNDGAAGSLSGQSNATINAVLRLHVVMDFLNNDKIKNWKSRSQSFTTMYQRTGRANDNQGLINVTKTDNNQVMFGNGKQNAKLTVSMQKVVTAVVPLSVIEVSGLIQPDWVFNLKNAPQHAPKKAPTPSPSDGPSPSNRHRKEAPQSAESPEASSPPEPDSDTGSADDSPAPAPGGSSHNAASYSSSAPAAACAVLVGLVAFAMGF